MINGGVINGTAINSLYESTEIFDVLSLSEAISATIVAASMTDTVNFTEPQPPIVSYEFQFAESLDLTPSFVHNSVTYDAFAELAVFIEFLEYSEDPIADTLYFIDTVTSLLSTPLRDTLAFSSRIYSNAVYGILKQNSLLFSEYLRLGFALIESDTVSFTENFAYQQQIIGLLRDTLAVSETKEDAAILFNAASVIWQMYEYKSYGFESAVTELMQLSSDEFYALMVKKVNTDTLAFDAVLNTPRVGVFAIEADQLDISDTVSSKATLTKIIQDNLAFMIVFEDGNDVYTGYVMNTRNKAVTTYTNYKFNSFGEAYGTLLATNSSGLYQIGGTNDAGSAITGRLLSGRFDPSGAGHQSRIEAMYLGIDTTDKVVVKTIDGEGIERWYRSTNPRSGGLETLRTKLGRGVKARYWQYEIVMDTAELETIELLPVVLSRKVR